MPANLWSPGSPVSSSVASAVAFTPTANIAGTNVQTAVEEVDTELRALVAGILADLISSSGGKGDELIRQIQAGGVARTLHARTADIKLITDYGNIVADGTDQTTNIVNWLTSLGSSAVGLYIIPYNVKFIRKTIAAALPVGIVLFNFSVINDYRSAGETTKRVGIISSDSSPNDTHFSIDTRHHAILALNNDGGSGSVSGQERKASIIWNSGEFEKGAIEKQGFRGVALKQYTKESGSTYWIETLRCLAPMEAVTANYELHAVGENISGAGVYRSTGNNIYISTGAGVCGSTPLVHTTGTASDGGVSWTYVDSADRTVYSVDEFGRWLINNLGAAGPTWRHKVQKRDPSGGNFLAELAATGINKICTWRMYATDGAGAEVASPVLRAEGSSLSVIKASGASTLLTFSDADGIKVFRTTKNHVTQTAGTTIDAANTSLVYLNYAAPVTITDIINGADGQSLRVVCLSNNITFTHSASMMMQGSANLVTPAIYSVVNFEKVPSSISNRWIEASRSIK